MAITIHYSGTAPDIGAVESVPVGVKVTIHYVGTAPDIGAVEANPTPPPVPPAVTASPAISGSTQVGSTLTASTGTWSGNPTSFAYEWQRANDSGFTSGVVTIGANQNTYLLVSADAGKFIRVRVTATNAGGSSTPAPSLSVGAITAQPPVETSPPVILGNPAVGSTLSVSNGVWTNGPILSTTYQWQRRLHTSDAFVNIAGATTASYVVQAGDAGYYIRCQVTVNN